MDGLRWLLLFFGILVVAGVYFYSRRERDKPSKPVQLAADAPRVAPTLSGDGDIEDAAVDDLDEPESNAPGSVKQKIVTLRLVARDGGAFRGDDLILGLRGIGLRHGKFGIFHRYDGNDEEQTVFSVASLIEPGSFDLVNVKDQEIPGVSLFLVLPGPVEGVEAFDSMMAAARALTQTLDAELLDESGSSLSIQRERYIREEIIQYQHSNLVT